jgi:choline-sulfatase
MLGEHGLWHKNTLLDMAARVPLLIAGPGLPRGKTVSIPVGHIDLAAALLEVAGVPRPEGLRGHSLLPLARGESGAHPGHAIAENHTQGNHTGSFMARKAAWKYICFAGDDPLLFNLESDPRETRNIAGRPETAQVQAELHNLLLSNLDPEAVSDRAFREQERRLEEAVRTHSAQGFYELLVGRLGKGQARALTNKHYCKIRGV